MSPWSYSCLLLGLPILAGCDRPPIPLIDAAPPSTTETATFALG